jgi:uncharacterized protein YbcV (DUF1398 family)
MVIFLKNKQPKTMFTKEQIHQAFSRVKTGADFPQLVQDLKSLGMSHYDNFVASGRTLFFGEDGSIIEGDAKYPDMPIATIASVEGLKHALKIHQQGQTDYPTFCKDAADAGVEKWTTHMVNMEVIYYDSEGNVVVVEAIPVPSSKV